MQFLKNNRTLILGVILIALVFWAYTAFFKQDSSTPTDMSAQAVGSDVLALFASLQSVTLDQSIFNSPLYRNLVDFSPELQNQPTGRTNPFASIGQN